MVRTKTASREQGSPSADSLASAMALPEPFLKVIQPAPDLPLADRVAVLRHCCPSATLAAVRRAAQDKGRPLLAAFHSLQGELKKRGHGKVASQKKENGKLKKTEAGERGTLLKPSVQKLCKMLEEAIRADAHQGNFLVGQEAAAPAQLSMHGKKRKLRGKTTPRMRTGFPDVLTCCACWEDGPPESMVLCEHAERTLKYTKSKMKLWAKTPAAQRRGGKHYTPTPDEYVSEMLRSVSRDIAPHVFCASCTRNYVMGTRVHGGSLRKMFCAGCTKVLRDAAEVNSGEPWWCEECGCFHGGDAVDMTGLGLDGIREATGLHHIEPLQAAKLSRVLGPMDLLQLRGLAADVSHPPQVPREVVKALRTQGARRCIFCSSANVLGEGCDAVMCESCGLVFNWSMAVPI